MRSNFVRVRVRVRVRVSKLTSVASDRALARSGVQGGIPPA